MLVRRFIISLAAAFLAALPLSAQKAGQTDSVVVLMNAKSLELIEDEIGFSYRKAIDARFLHNNTYLICDTALWNVNTRVINAFGHVQILQDQTVLSSEKLDYLIDEDLAQFRGNQVQLMDKDGNTLRTRFLDYNTRDSVALFRNGASMRDKDGQVIESMDGTYDSKEKVFTFEQNVNMYTDSVYVKTSRLQYHTDYDFAEFFGEIDAWKGRNMLSANDGTYDKTNERFFFTGDVHVMSDTQEGWSDSLYFDRNSNDVEMYGNIQVLDTTRKVAALGDILLYVDSLSRVTLEKNASVVAETDEDGKIDTVYVGARKFVYFTVPKCDIDGNIVEMAAKRLDDIAADPVSAYRYNAAEAAAKAAEAAKDENDPNNPEAAAKRREKAAAVDVRSLEIDPSEISDVPASGSEEDSEDISLNAEIGEALPSPEIPDSTGAVSNADSLSPDIESPADSLVQEPLLDSVALREQQILDSIAQRDQFVADSIAMADSLAKERELFVLDSLANRDTTKIGFLTALKDVKLFRSDMQVVCDSLEYSDLDSLARLFISPIVWNEQNRQYSADSLTIAIKGQRMDKASLMSNAFIIIQEDSLCYDQIKSTEILAYFDSTTALKRFDALGGANALFYLQENDAFATANKVESKMLSAIFKDGDIDRVFYFDNPKNDAYPVVQLPEEEKRMKGFNWQPELRPTGKEDITPLELRRSERTSYLKRSMPAFPQTEKYFPGHIASIKKMLASQDSIRRARHDEEVRRQQEAEAREIFLQDSLEAVRIADSISLAESVADSLAVQSDPVAADSLTAVPAVTDSLSIAPADSLDTAPAVEEHIPSKAEIKAQKAAEAEAKRQARIEAREERWAELDERDALKQARKDAKIHEKKRQRTYKTVLSAEKEAAKDQKRYEAYVRRFEKKKLRLELREEARDTRKQ